MPTGIGPFLKSAKKEGKPEAKGEDMLTVKQVAEKLGVSPTTVYGLCQRRKLRHLRVGLGRGAVRVDEKDLDEYLEGASVGPERIQPAPPRQRFKHLRVS